MGTDWQSEWPTVELSRKDSDSEPQSPALSVSAWVWASAWLKAYAWNSASSQGWVSGLREH